MRKDTNENILILAVDDNQEGLFALSSLLEHHSFQVITASDGSEVLGILGQESPDLILMDVNMPVKNGFETTKAVREDSRYSEIPIILLTSRDDIHDIRTGLRAGATDYIKKPYNREELLARIEVVLQNRGISQSASSSDEEADIIPNIIGESRVMREVFDLIERIKASETPVVVTGESGTGKELVVKAIHGKSVRSEKPLVIQNCSALTDTLLESELFGHTRGSFTGAVKDKKGLFEIADGGTLFLDELGEMSSHLQAKLLRVLQDGTFTPVGSHEEKKVDVRVLSATHRDLEQMVRDGSFREDLYYRLHVVHIHLPPLRTRSEDIPALVSYFLEERGYAEAQLSSEAATLLQHYRWPGNIRELRNEVERIVALSPTLAQISPQNLSEKFMESSQQSDGSMSEELPATSLKEAVAALEEKMIARALQQCSGNKSEAARILDISRSSLIQKTKLYFGNDDE